MGWRRGAGPDRGGVDRATRGKSRLERLRRVRAVLEALSKGRRQLCPAGIRLSPEIRQLDHGGIRLSRRQTFVVLRRISMRRLYVAPHFPPAAAGSRIASGA